MNQTMYIKQCRRHLTHPQVAAQTRQLNMISGLTHKAQPINIGGSHQDPTQDNRVIT